MAQTKKNLVDSIRGILTRFGVTDESRLDPDYLGYKIDQVRAQLISQEYIDKKEVSPAWLSDLGIVTFYKVNIADDPSIITDCVVSKTVLPQTIHLWSDGGNIDLGVNRVLSATNSNQYYFKRMSMWSYTPQSHTNSKFNYYDRINTAMYVNADVDKLRIVAVLLNPSDGFIKNSAPVLSGAIVSGTVYKVMFGQIIYSNVVYTEGTTFTGTATTTYTGTGTAYLNSQATAFADTDPYPATPEMLRQIELEILTKEFGIEMKSGVDQRNDSRDDAVKGS